MEYHNPVLLKESVDGLDINLVGYMWIPGGGHQERFWQASPEGKLFAFDQDQDALANTIDDDRFVLINENFRFLKRFLLLWS
jgi:16S rRNA (cytosine1402-N4)-methyltransferase